MRFIKKVVPDIYLGLLLIFIYLPIVILIVYSFNSLPKSFIWGGFTLDNYKSLFKGSDGSGILESLIETLKVAAIASVASTAFGVVSSLGLAYLNKKLQNLAMTMTYVPNVMPDLVTGISFMLLFSFLGVQKSEFTLIMSHIALCVPFAILSISDYLISNFNVDSSIQTLPMMIYSMAKLGVNPKMNALTTLMFGAVLILMVLSNLSSFKKAKNK